MVHLKKFLVILILFLLALGNLGVSGESRDELVYLVPLEGAVEYGLHSYLERVFTEALGQGASGIILQFNTPGGRVDAAQEIKDLVQGLPVPVYAYVKPQALSAGAYLALACDGLYMAPGSTLGAAEPRVGLGPEEVADEKVLSFWEGEMRTQAELRGRDPEIAAAMVRREISIPGIVEEGRLLTFTTGEAREAGFIDGVFDRVEGLLEHLGYPGARLVQGEMRAAEKLARYITHPVLATLLLTIAMAALVIEIMTAGFGVAGSISITCFVLYFGGHIIAGLAGYEVVILFLIGIILLLVEAFITGFGIVGGVGILALGGSIVLSAADTGEGLRNFILALVMSSLIISISLKYMVKSKWLDNLILRYREDKDLGYVGPLQLGQLLGKEGVALTSLRPAGAVEIGGNRVDVVSQGDFIARGEQVEVIKIEGTRVIVRPVPRGGDGG